VQLEYVPLLRLLRELAELPRGGARSREFCARRSTRAPATSRGWQKARNRPGKHKSSACMAEDYFFEVDTPLGFRVRTTRAHWEFLVGSKHPAMRGRRADTIQVLAEPEQVRRSRKDLSVYLFYRSEGAALALRGRASSGRSRVPDHGPTPRTRSRRESPYGPDQADL
jgi:hypothetical protein